MDSTMDTTCRGLHHTVTPDRVQTPMGPLTKKEGSKCHRGLGTTAQGGVSHSRVVCGADVFGESRGVAITRLGSHMALPWVSCQRQSRTEPQTTGRQWSQEAGAAAPRVQWTRRRVGTSAQRACASCQPALGGTGRFFIWRTLSLAGVGSLWMSALWAACGQPVGSLWAHCGQPVGTLWAACGQPVRSLHKKQGVDAPIAASAFKGSQFVCEVKTAHLHAPAGE